MKAIPGIMLVALAIGIIALSQSVYIVDQREQAIVLQLGAPVGDIKGPGLHFKIPVVQDVRMFDRRILSVDPRPEQMVVSSTLRPEDTSDETQGLGNVSGEPIIVDTFARYKIIDPLMFMKTLRTITEANDRIEAIVNESTRNALGNTTLAVLLSAQREAVMQKILDRVNNTIAEDDFGIEIVDIRIVRADLTPALRQSTVRRMISELKERATETRAKGEERALEIRSTAEKERAVLLAEAERDAQIMKGQGDEEAIRIYADAFNKDSEFYSFVRSMEAYKNTLADPDTRLILSPDSKFFQHFKGSVQ